MKITLNTNQIADMIRQDSPDSWSYNGAKALAEFMEEYEEESGEEVEFDAVEIRCGWSEYDSPQDAAENYGWKPSRDIEDDGQECDAEALQWLEDRAHVIEFDGGIIVSAF